MCQYPGMFRYILWIQKCIFDACRLSLHNSGLICNQATALLTVQWNWMRAARTHECHWQNSIGCDRRHILRQQQQQQRLASLDSVRTLGSTIYYSRRRHSEGNKQHKVSCTSMYYWCHIVEPLRKANVFVLNFFYNRAISLVYQVVYNRFCKSPLHILTA